MSNNGDAPQQVMWCDVGHEWTRPKTRGFPRWCPDHKMFMQMDFSPRLKCPALTLIDWEVAQEVLEEPGYVKRWTKKWERIGRFAAATKGSWARVDKEALGEYVQHLRMAEYHAKIAEAEPYFRTDKDSIKPHPGFQLAERELAKAKKCAVKLGLEVDTEEKSGPAAKDYTSRLQESAEESDELKPAVGPDGASL